MTNSKMTFAYWDRTPASNQEILIKAVIRQNPKEFFDDFERYSEREEFGHLLDGFIRITRQYLQSHRHFGAKAVWEILRWESYAQDGDKLFQLNNSYASSVCRLVRLLFPLETTEFFEVRKAA